MTVIAMTREIGSGGTEVAAGVAAALGLKIVNSEIVVSTAAGPNIRLGPGGERADPGLGRRRALSRCSARH
jgi:cytidylate kinase